MGLTLNFEELNKNNTDIAGGKGASLGEMTQAGIPVPPGFVVLSTTFDEFIKEVDLIQEIDAILDGVNHEEIHTVENASEKIQALINNATMPEKIAREIEEQFKKLDTEYVAVRSSATAEDGAENAWAGQLDSFLNIRKENLLEKVQHCWASLFTPRAIFYRFEKGLHSTKISVAVVVQRMVNSEKSGIAFSVHPVTEDQNQLIIEAGFGLGEAIVSGQITPDSYVVEKEPRRTIDINVAIQNRGLYRVESGGNEWVEIKEPEASSQVLSEEQIKELAGLIIKIENHYSFPCDIEWAFEGGKFYITQSRPITTLSDVKLKQFSDKEKYDLHFSGSGFSILLLDMIFNNHDTYGMVDYVVLYEDGISRGYLSERGLKECHDIGESLLDDEFFNKIYKQSKELDEKLKQYESVVLDKNNIDAEWEKSSKFNSEFCWLYRFYEQPFQKALENYILKFIPKDELINLLSQKNLDAIQNQQVRKYVERLISMGKMKLQLHEDSEKFFTDDVFEKYVSEKNNLPINLVVAMSVKEFRGAMHGKMVVTIDELKERLKGSVFVKECGEWKLYSGEKYLYWKNIVQKTQNEEIKGEVAFSGVVTGKVVLHMHWSGVTEIKDGDVLVTGMTNPQMIPMLKKASAIVTDEGGITCHAAIIARELSKPCVVGTKNATQILKDGDFVEVDANRGIIKILKKYGE